MDPPPDQNPADSQANLFFSRSTITLAEKIDASLAILTQKHNDQDQALLSSCLNEAQSPTDRDFVCDLDFLSRHPPNTAIRLSRSRGHFVSVGDLFAGLPFVQTCVIVWKGYTEHQFQMDIDDFCNAIIQRLQKIYDTALHSNETEQSNAVAVIWLTLCAIRRALQGLGDDGGLKGLLKTYPNPPLNHLLQKSISYLEEESLAIFKKATKLDRTQNFGEASISCPEDNFSEEDWEAEMNLTSRFRMETVSFLRYYSRYAVPLAGAQLRLAKGGLSWWNKIISFENDISLFLGALPLAAGAGGYLWRNDVEGITAEGVKAILSVTEVFENNSEGLIESPITPMQWREAGVKHLQLPARDYQSLPLDVILRGVSFVDWNVRNGRSVYIHCKAGQSRSALIMICYLIKHRGFQGQAALDLIKSIRKQAGFSAHSDKWKTMNDFQALCQKK